MSTTLTPITITPTTPPIMATKDNNGEVWVPLKPACEAMGINSNKQAERLNRQEWAVTTIMVSTGSDGKNYKMLMMDRQTVTMWLATLDASRVSPESRALIVAYQKQAAKALDNYFHEGGALNPNATTDQLDRLSREVQRRRETADLLILLQDVLPKSYSATVGKELIAESRGHAPTVPEEERTLEVKAFLADKGVPEGLVTKYASSFGRKVKELYIAATGDLPATAPKVVGGATREVNYYTESDRPIFDAVWDGYASDHTLKLSAN